MYRRLAITFVFLSFLFIISSPAYASAKVKIAVFPFNDTSSSAVNFKIASVLTAELSKTDFIEIVPVEVIKKNIIATEPEFLWTEQRDTEKRGGILWSITPKIIEEAAAKNNAAYTVHGNISWFNAQWRIDAYLSDADKKITQVYSVSGDNEKNMPERLEGMSKEIAAVIKKEWIIKEAEEDVRLYMAGALTLPVIIERVEIQARYFSDSIPLNAILLDLYIKDKASYKDKIMGTGLNLIRLYKPSNEMDAQYLLSLNLDPFDIAAKGYEERDELNKAIEVREKALNVFPFYAARHKKGIGISAYNLAKRYEEKSEKKKAVEYYKKALLNLSPESEEFLLAKEKLNLLEKR